MRAGVSSAPANPAINATAGKGWRRGGGGVNRNSHHNPGKQASPTNSQGAVNNIATKGPSVRSGAMPTAGEGVRGSAPPDFTAFSAPRLPDCYSTTTPLHARRIGCKLGLNVVGET